MEMQMILVILGGLFVFKGLAVPMKNTLLVKLENNGTWNDAYQHCTCTLGGRPLQPDSDYKMNQLLKYKTILELDANFWVGVHYSQSAIEGWVWTDGSNVTGENPEWSNPGGESISDDQRCVRLKNMKLSDKSCEAIYQIVCEIEKGSCTFDHFPRRDAMVEPVLTLDTTVETCLQICLLYHTGNIECSGVSVHGNASCSIFTTDVLSLGSEQLKKGNASTEMYIKNCYRVSEEQISYTTDVHIFENFPRTACTLEKSDDISSFAESMITDSYYTTIEPYSFTTDTLMTTALFIDSSNELCIENELTTTAFFSQTITETLSLTSYNNITLTETVECASFSPTISPTPTSITWSKSDSKYLSGSTILIPDSSNGEFDNMLDVHLLSSYKRKFVSIKDSRPSAVAIGVVGIISLFVFFTVVIACDLCCKKKHKHNI